MHFPIQHIYVAISVWNLFQCFSTTTAHDSSSVVDPISGPSTSNSSAGDRDRYSTSTSAISSSLPSRADLVNASAIPRRTFQPTGLPKLLPRSRFRRPTDSDLKGGGLQAMFEESFEEPDCIKVPGTGRDTPPSFGTSSAVLRRLTDSSRTVMLEGHCYGCTAIVIMSEQGVYVGHFWEKSFKEETTTKVMNQAWARFTHDVLLAIVWGGINSPDAIAAYNSQLLETEDLKPPPFGDRTMPPLENHVGKGGMFGPGTNTRVSIFTPWHSHLGRGHLAYDKQVKKLKQFLQIFLNLSQRPQVVGFTAPVEGVSSVTKPKKYTDGRLLFQYNPEEIAFVVDETPRGNCYKQQARYDLWLEEYHAQDVLFEAWDNQLSHNPLPDWRIEDYNPHTDASSSRGDSDSHSGSFKQRRSNRPPKQIHKIDKSSTKITQCPLPSTKKAKAPGTSGNNPADVKRINYIISSIMSSTTSASTTSDSHESTSTPRPS